MNLVWRVRSLIHDIRHPGCRKETQRRRKEGLALMQAHHPVKIKDGIITCKCGFATDAYHPATGYEGIEFVQHMQEVTPDWLHVGLYEMTKDQELKRRLA